jgi:Zn-dependent protease
MASAPSTAEFPLSRTPRTLPQRRAFKWSFRIGRLFGIDVFVHVTFLVLLVWVALSDLLREETALAALTGVGFTVAVFAIIVLHELGHALVARRFGIATRDITLLPIGGIARLERFPEKPRQELLVALAGPAVNVVLAVALAAALLASGQSLVWSETEGLASFVVRLFWVNLVIAGFNLLPAFPMDGGRVLRALLTLRSDHLSATRTAAAIGRGIAIALGLLGLLTNPLLAVVALFVWIGAGQEAAGAEIESLLDHVPVEAAMMSDFKVLRTNDTLAMAAAELLAGAQVDFPVVDEAGNLVGLLSRAHLIAGLAKSAGSERVDAHASRTFERAQGNEFVARVLERMAASGSECALVVRDDRLTGVLTLENVSELLAIRRALGTGHPSAQLEPV